MRLLVGLASFVVLVSTAPAMTLAFSNKFNAVINPLSDIQYYAAPAPNGQFYSVGVSGLDLLVRRYDANGNIWAERRIDGPSGGIEAPYKIASDGSGGLYIAYGSIRLGYTQSKVMKLNLALATQWDVVMPVGAVQSNIEGLQLDNTGVYALVQTASTADVVKLNLANGSQMFLSNLGAAETRSMVLRSNIAVAGRLGLKATLFILNSTTGAVTQSVQPASLNLSDSNGNNYFEVVSNGIRFLAVGMGESGGQKNIITSCLLDGSGASHTLGNADVHRAMVSHQNAAYWTLRNSQGDVLVSKRDFNGAQSASTTIPHGPDQFAAVSADGSKIAVALDDDDPEMVGLLDNSLANLSYVIRSDPRENLRNLIPGSMPSGFHSVGFVISKYQQTTGRYRMFGDANAIWEMTLATSGFPTQDTQAVAEDGTGAWYLFSNVNLGLTLQYVPMVLKVNAAGAVLWSRQLDFGSADIGYGGRIAVHPEGGVVISGGSQNINDSSSQDIRLVRLNANGATVFATGYQYQGKQTVANALTVAPDGAIYIGGQTFFNQGNFFDSITVKFSAAGSPVWTRVYGNGVDSDTVEHIAMLPNGQVATAVRQGTAVLVRVFNSAGTVMWTQGLPDSGGANPSKIEMAQEPNGNLVLAIRYFDMARSVIGVRRLNAVAKTILMQSTVGTNSDEFEVTGTPSGAVGLAFQNVNGFRLAQFHPTTGAIQFNVGLARRVLSLTSDRKNNIYAAYDEQPNIANPPNAAVKRFTSAGAQTHYRTFAGQVKHVRLGTGDAVWAFGNRLVKDRGQEASFTKWTQNLGP